MNQTQLTTSKVIMDLSYCSSSLFLILYIVFASILLLFKIINPNKKKNLPPGPWKFPVIGNLHLLAGSDPPQRILRNLANKYGPLMHLQLGEITALIISSPETAKQFLKTNDVIFASRPSLLATEINCYGNTDIAFSPYGDYWRQLRRICLLHLFTEKRVRSFRQIREEEVSDLCKSVAAKGAEGLTLNLTEIVRTANLNIVVRAAFGKKSGDDVAVLSGIIKEAQSFLTVFNVVDVFPSMRFLRLFSSMKKKIEKHHRHLNKITDSIIEDRRREMPRYGENESETDHNFLDVLLRLQGDGSLKIPLTTNNIKSILLDGVGVESSTTTTTWAMAEMLKNPTILKKAQDEVRSVFNSNNQVTEILFHKLHYLKLVIKETLRLHPPGPLLLPRESREALKINGYEIPTKSWVLVNAWAIGRDPKYWEDAERFIPERFLEKSVDFKGTELEYIPFGAGKRICPAAAFGIANIEILLAMILFHFDWILPHGMRSEELDMKECYGFGGRKKSDLTVIPIVRRPIM